MEDKTLDCAGPTSSAASDVVVHGNPDLWKCMCKASSKSQGWMKSTKVMYVNAEGCLVQVTTQQRNPDGSWAIAEALTFVRDAVLADFGLTDTRA